MLLIVNWHMLLVGPLCRLPDVFTCGGYFVLAFSPVFFCFCFCFFFSGG